MLNAIDQKSLSSAHNFCLQLIGVGTNRLIQMWWYASLWTWPQSRVLNSPDYRWSSLFVPAPIEQKIVSRARRFLVYCIERSCDMNFGHKKFLAANALMTRMTRAKFLNRILPVSMCMPLPLWPSHSFARVRGGDCGTASSTTTCYWRSDSGTRISEPKNAYRT